MKIDVFFYRGSVDHEVDEVPMVYQVQKAILGNRVLQALKVK